MDVPLTFHDVINSKYKEKLLDAIIEELKNLYCNNVMTFVKLLPPDKKAIKVRWVFNRDSNNNISKFKARIVAKGYSQVKGINFDLTFSPTLGIDSIKLILVLAAKFKWSVFQLDIKAAYLNANLDKDIYVAISPGDQNYNKGFLKLNKALYGLKQSGRQWNETITSFLKSIGFKQLLSEPCMFAKINSGKTLCIIGLYVDNMIITGKMPFIMQTIHQIKNKFRISKCGHIEYILGIKVEVNNNRYTISQISYIENILSKYKISNIRKTKTPCIGDNITENKTPFNKTTF